MAQPAQRASSTSVPDNTSPNGYELRAARVFLRPIANPFALGFVGLAVATLIMSGLELGWIPAAEGHQSAVLIIAFAPTILLVASVFGFLARDAVAATAMGVLSVTWLSVGLSSLLATPHGHTRALALLLFVAGTAIFFSAVVAAQSKVVPAVVLLLTAARFVLTGITKWGVPTTWTHIAGWVGVALCAAALYAAISLELEDIKHRSILPTLRRASGRRALDNRLEEQVEQVAAESGVRSQL
jgi:succinate-acetate transporter protein